MAGLIFIALIIGWFFAARWLARKISVRIANRALRWLSTALLVVVFMALPVLDEIIGGVQFRALCKEHTTLKIDAEKIKGKTIKVSGKPLNLNLTGTAIPIYFSRISYLDAVSNEELASTGSLDAKGGLLIRTLSFSNSINPITLHPPTCGGPGMLPTSKKYFFTLLKN